MTQVDIMYNILKNEHVYSLKKLKIKLEENNLSLNNEEILFLIVDTLKKEICDFKIEKKYCSNNLYKCFKYLNCPNNYQYITNNNLMIVKLEKIVDKINEKINKKKYNLNLIHRNNIEFLEKIKTNLELTIIQLRTPEKEIDKKDDFEEILYKFIFDIKNYEYVNEIFKTFPELINYKTKNNKYVLDDVITKYIESLNKEFLNTFDTFSFDIMYYEKIIDLFINSENFNISKCYRDLLIKRLNIVSKELKTKDTSVRKRKKIRFFLNNIIEKLQTVKTTIDEKFFSNINYKYGIQDSYGDTYDFEIPTKNINCNVIDLTNLYTITVDYIGTKSFDDAFSFQKTNDGYTLYVFISDVTNYVERNTKLDEIALKKGASIYLPNYTLTMLPHNLTYDKCSLIKNEKRRVIAYKYNFSNNIDLINFSIFNAYIKVDDNYNHEDIKNILNSNDVDKLNFFYNVLDFSNELNKLNIYDKKYHILKKIERNINLRNSKNYVSNDFISNFMVLTNYFVSEKFNNNNLPFIYRNNNSQINDTMIDTLKDEELGSLSSQIVECINKMYKSSTYSNINLGHNGLKLSYYGHTTTPIRNYSALFNQYLIHRYFLDNNKIYDRDIYEDENDIENISNYLNDRLFYNQEYIDEYVKVYKKTDI